MSLFPKNINEYLMLSGIPRGPYSNVYVVDTVNGSDSNNGTSVQWPLASVEAAYALCTDAQHDVVLMIAGATANNLTATIAWSKNYTHLVGWSPDMPGMGQRCRIVGTTAVDPVALITFSGQGCIVKNIKFSNEKDADVDSGAVVVSGNRCYFKNCTFEGMQNTTVAARAGSYSLKVTGSENYFEDCNIGYDSITRGAGEPPELLLATGCSKAVFNHCRILTRSETITASPVSITATNLGYVEFDNCIFVNTSTNWAVSLTDCFSITATGTHYVALRGNNQLVGITGWADTATRIYQNQAAPDGTGGTNVAPTT